jgi:hypothetical protein
MCQSLNHDKMLTCSDLAQGRKNGEFTADVQEAKSTISRADLRLRDFSRCNYGRQGLCADLEFKGGCMSFVAKCVHRPKKYQRGKVGTAYFTNAERH